MEQVDVNAHNRRSDNEIEAEFPSAGDVMAVAVRHWRAICLAFVSVLCGAILIAFLQPNHYKAEMKILVKRDRADAVVTSNATAALPPPAEVTEEELNSEVELLKSGDLLEKIVLACNLQQVRTGKGFRLPARFEQAAREDTGGQNISSSGLSSPASAALASSPWARPEVGGPRQDQASDEASAQVGTLKFHPVEVASYTPAHTAESGPIAAITVHPPLRPREERVGIAVAVQALESHLKVDVLKRTNLIGATYESPDPEMAARVLNTLANFYIEKHVAVHRPSGAFDFFRRETQRNRDELSAAEARLLNFDRDAGVISASLEKEITVQKLADLEIAQREAAASVVETHQRISALEDQMQSIPPRVVTQIREADDGGLLSQLKVNLLTLEQKRIELLAKFQPGYRPVQELDGEIARTRAALAEKSQLHDETTDRDPTYEWARGELEKARADLASFEARSGALAETVRSYQGYARALEKKEILQGDLMRTIKADEESYLVSLRKEEEARISDALDRGRILNVAIAEAPVVPTIPSNHRVRIVVFGIFLATLCGIAVGFIWDRADTTFRTEDEVRSVLNIPVLAAMPQNGNGRAANC